MAGFERKPLRDVLGERGYIRGPFGSALVRSDLLEQGIPVYEQQHAITGIREFRFFINQEKLKELSRFQVKPNDLIISCSGTVGRISVIQPDDPMGIISQALLILRPHTNDILPEFLYYFLSTHEGQHALFQASHGSVQVNIAPRAIVEQIEVPVPRIAEQRAIAHILGTLDDKIELNRRMNETLEAMARAIFKSWFVDATESGMPKGWKVGTVGDDFNLTMGQSPPGETYNEMGEGLPFFQGRTDFGSRYPTRRVFCTTPTRLAGPGDTLVSVRAPVGDINMAAERCCIGRGVAAVRHKTGSRSYTYYMMHSLVETFGRFEAEGTVFGSIGRDDFQGIKLIIPPAELVQEFERTAFPIDQAIENNENQSRTLAAIRDALLPKLLSGEIRVHAINKFVSSS